MQEQLAEPARDQFVQRRVSSVQQAVQVTRPPPRHEVDANVELARNLLDRRDRQRANVSSFDPADRGVRDPRAGTEFRLRQAAPLAEQPDRGTESGLIHRGHDDRTALIRRLCLVRRARTEPPTARMKSRNAPPISTPTMATRARSSPPKLGPWVETTAVSGAGSSGGGGCVAAGATAAGASDADGDGDGAGVAAMAARKRPRPRRQ